MDSNQYAIELVTYLLVLVVYFYELIVYTLLERNAFDSIAFFSQCRTGHKGPFHAHAHTYTFFNFRRNCFSLFRVAFILNKMITFSGLNKVILKVKFRKIFLTFIKETIFVFTKFSWVLCLRVNSNVCSLFISF